MTIVVWIVSGLLALAYLAAGGMKIITPKAKLGPQMGWADDFSATQVKLIGAVEVVGAIGLILPELTNIAPILTPLAASGLVLVQIGAIAVNVRRADRQVLPVNFVFLVLAGFVATARFLGY